MGFFQNETYAYCMPCHPSCKGCTGPKETDCQYCYGEAQTSFLRFENYTCGACPSQFFPELERQLCIECDPSCLTCQNTQPNSCITCQ